jgi:hypothetical protein
MSPPKLPTESRPSGVPDEGDVDGSHHPMSAQQVAEMRARWEAERAELKTKLEAERTARAELEALISARDSQGAQRTPHRPAELLVSDFTEVGASTYTKEPMRAAGLLPPYSSFDPTAGSRVFEVLRPTSDEVEKIKELAFCRFLLPGRRLWDARWRGGGG